MPLTELTCNFHMHTPYSDGEWYHADIAQAALNAGLDVICVTDHNTWVDGLERYYEKDGRRLLLLVGEEVHDQTRQPQRNHLLVLGARTELAERKSTRTQQSVYIQERDLWAKREEWIQKNQPALTGPGEASKLLEEQIKHYD